MNTLLPRRLENRLTTRAKNALYLACRTKEARPIHLLYALCLERGSLAKSILEAHRVRPSWRAPRRKTPVLTADIKDAIKRSCRIAADQNQPYVGTEHLLYAIVCGSNPSKEVLETLNAQKITKIKKHLETIFSQSVRPSSLQDAFKERLLSDFSRAHQGKKVKVKIKKSARKRRTRESEAHSHPAHEGSLTPALDALCENLTALAHARSLDPLVGREKEISRIVNILSRRTKNNPLLVGEPGVGKTAVVQGLAQRIVDGEVPGSLLHKQIFSLNLNSLVAGTMFRGDFEARMQDIISEASSPDIILFIDEIHTAIGAGSAQGTLDAANILKPSLSQGALQCIGATTTDEYRRYIEKDRALERRLQPVFIEEETQEQALATLLRLKKLYEKHHEITIEDEAVEAAVALSSRYIRDRFLPDKAIDLLDEAASRLKSSAAIPQNAKRVIELEKHKSDLQKSKELAISEENYENAVVFKHKEWLAEEELRRFRKKFPLFGGRATLTKSDIEEALEEITGMPIAKESDAQAFTRLKTSLAKEIIGQRQAINNLISALKRSRAGISPQKRHGGSFLFLGPCGVGKTALARVFAEASSQKFIKLDMSEYAEPHTISRLIGSPPGYIGYGEGGELTEKIRRRPHAVVLFDEIEKAHPQVHNLLLSILEEGAIEDALGRTVSFQNAQIIMTSNAQIYETEDSEILGFSKKNAAPGAEGRKAEFVKLIKETLRPEVLNRIDNIIVFSPLGEKEIFAITGLFLNKLKTQMGNLNIEISPKAVKHISQKAYKAGEGARCVRSTIERLVETPLAEHLIKNSNAKNVKVAVRGGKIIVN